MTQTYPQVTFDGWTLNGSILTPTHARLQEHTKQISRLNSEESMLTFEFAANPSRVLRIHRSFLVSAGGPLRALVTAPFSEATTNTVSPDDSFEAFDVLYNFLYCLPIDISNAPVEMPLVAHRWQLDIIFQACFAWAEVSQNWNSRLLVEHWMTVLSLVQPPRRFCLFFARVFGAQFERVAPNLEHQDWTWAKKNVWDIFRSRHMLKHVVHTIVHLATADFSELLLDVILRQLEDKLSEEEAAELLRELDWNGVTCANVLKSATMDKWSARAWRLLALTPRTGQPSGGEDFRLQWTFESFGIDFRNAPVCATRDSLILNSLSLSMSLQSWCWKDPLSLKLQIREGPESIRRRFGRRRVSAIVSATDDSCSCGLFTSKRPSFEEYIAEPWPHFDVTRLTLDSFAKDGGVEYVLMDPREFEAWRSRHRECGLLVSVRLRVFDEELDDTLPDQQKASLRRKCMNLQWTRNGSSSRCHFDCPCVRCRSERRVSGDQGSSRSHAVGTERYSRHGPLELSLLS